MLSNRDVVIAAFASIVILTLIIVLKTAYVPAPISSQIVPNEKVSPLKTDPSFFQGTTTMAAAKRVDTTPVITAKTYLVGNVNSGQIYLEYHGREILPIASLSKLVTAIVATNLYTPTTTVVISKNLDDVPADDSKLKTGESFTFKEILYPLLLDSSNIAAEAIASTSDRSQFISQMKGYAEEIGMSSQVSFEDPSGLTPKNAASARDLFALTRYLYKYRPDILAITRIPEISVGTTSDHGSHDFVSTHPFVKDPSFLGGKTGRTAWAGETLITIFKISNQPVAIIVLGSDENKRAEDTARLIEEIGLLVK